MRVSKIMTLISPCFLYFLSLLFHVFYYYYPCCYYTSPRFFYQPFIPTSDLLLSTTTVVVVVCCRCRIQTCFRTVTFYIRTPQSPLCLVIKYNRKDHGTIGIFVRHQEVPKVSVKWISIPDGAEGVNSDLHYIFSSRQNLSFERVNM